MDICSEKKWNILSGHYSEAVSVIRPLKDGKLLSTMCTNMHGQPNINEERIGAICATFHRLRSGIRQYALAADRRTVRVEKVRKRW